MAENLQYLWIVGQPKTSSKTLAYKVRINLQSLQEFRVFIGSGEYIVCREVCRQVHLVIQKLTLKEDLYVLAMEGVNDVLDIQWSETL